MNALAIIGGSGLEPACRGFQITGESSGRLRPTALPQTPVIKGLMRWPRAAVSRSPW